MTDRRAARALTIVSIVAVAFGLAVRVWVTTGPLGVLNADEVVSALMARDLLDGTLTTFFWNQSYGGTLQLFPLAAAIAVFGDRAGLMIVPIVEWSAIVALTYLLAHRRVDRSTAAAVAALSAVAPAAAIWMSTRPMLFYNATLILGLAAIALADGAASRLDRRLQFALLGVTLGLGWWTSTQIMYFAVPALYVVARHRRLRSWADAAAGAGGVVLGALPWIVHNVRTSGSSLRTGPPRDGGLWDHLRAQVERGWPMAAGARRPFDERWLTPGPGWLAIMAMVAAAAGIAFVFLHWPEIRSPLAGVVPAFFVLHLAAPTGSFVGNGRYYVFVAPAVAYAIVAALSRWRHAAFATLALISIAAAVSTATLLSMRDVQFGPEDPAELLAALDERGIDHLYANYWVAYPLAWADDSLVVSPSFTERRPDWSREVRDADDVAYVFWLPQSDDAARAADLVPRLESVGIDEQFDVGGYRVVIPSRNIPPEDLPAATAG